ncbi:MAG: hypothetical protein JJT85_03370 [Chromatiales bacterium]|nr:hypothetical protein [Chromatiales bacterium]
MLSLTFLAYAIIHLAIWFWCWWAWNRVGRPGALTMVLFVNTLLWYDNFRIGIGRFIGEGDLLYVLSVPSFVWHWTFLPLLVIAAGSIARLAGLGWASSEHLRGKLAMGAFCVVAVFLMYLDWPYSLALLIPGWDALPTVNLGIACIDDTVRYATSLSPAQFCTPDAVPFSYGPGPKVAITMNLIMIGVGIALWIQRGYKWLVIGPGLMIVAALPLYGVYNLAVANFGEVLFTLGVVSSCIHFARKREEARGREVDLGTIGRLMKGYSRG